MVLELIEKSTCSWKKREYRNRGKERREVGPLEGSDADYKGCTDVEGVEQEDGERNLAEKGLRIPQTPRLNYIAIALVSY